MTTFDSPAAFARHLQGIQDGLPATEEAARRSAAAVLLDAAREAAEQEGHAALAAWVTVEIRGEDLVIGLKDDTPADLVALSRELEHGSVGVPPWPILAAAGFRHGEAASSVMGRIMARALAGLPLPSGGSEP